jgi:hypothetical protein
MKKFILKLEIDDRIVYVVEIDSQTYNHVKHILKT